MNTELYISTDVETDGPIPGPNSMLSFGSAAFLETGEMVSTYSANLHLLPGAEGDPKTMKWWSKNPIAWAEHRTDMVSPETAMGAYALWLAAFHQPVVFVAYPAGFDFLFIYWYLMKFNGASPFSFSALDIKTLAFAELGAPWKQTIKGNMPLQWFKGVTHPHTHKAIDDAIEQGQLFIHILKENRARLAALSQLCDLKKCATVLDALVRKREEIVKPAAEVDPDYEAGRIALGYAKRAGLV